MNLPNQLTVLRILLTPVFVVLLFSPSIAIKYVALLVLLVATLTDWYDGYFARKYGYVTAWGKFLDPLADKILVSAAMFALYFLKKVELWMILVIIIRDFLITGLRSYAMFRGRPVVTSQLAKVKTFAQMTIVYIILVLYLLELTYTQYKFGKIFFTFLEKIQLGYWVMFSITMLTIYTALQYFSANRQNLLNMVLDVYYFLCPKRKAP
ncbi:CDP-diacylglycerol--glycerol-3-phosphate 3-phosphatidyltransferase [candidate division KSB1 bacterium]|nr:CDP-diacylglycerol--glycerol-3-phosphate 3-phosphatidyltransferase [candidate division KSB1 bacterium]